MADEGYGHGQWRGRTDGSPLMHRMLIGSFRFMPLWAYYFLLVGIVPFYMVARPVAFRACYRFFREALGYGRLRALGGACVNHFRFGQIVIDRFASYAGHEFHMDIEGKELFGRLMSQPGGFLVVIAHVGNAEIAGYTLPLAGKIMSAVVYGGEAESVMSRRRSRFAGCNVTMIPVKPDLSHVFLINNALHDGGIVSMPADRLYGSQRAVTMPFFGRDARFPEGPFMTAWQRDVPVVMMTVMKAGMRRYALKVHEIALSPRSLSASRKDAVEKMVECYARELESTVVCYPTQWFNYYDFWT